MKSLFRELFEYSHHFNQKWADIFIDSQDKITERSVKLLSHVLNAHDIWNNRIDQQKAPFGVWDIHDLSNLKSIDRANYEQTLKILDRSDLNEIISYKTSRGQPFKNSIRDILFHVINHSTHHRGQIAADFRQNGLEPPVTDYIFFKR